MESDSSIDPTFRDLIAVSRAERVSAAQSARRLLGDLHGELRGAMCGVTGGREAAERLVTFRAHLDGVLARLLRSRSAYYWICLSRRIELPLRHSYSAWNWGQVRREVDLSLLKYGRPDSSGKRLGIEFVDGRSSPSHARVRLKEIRLIMQVHAVVTLLNLLDEAITAVAWGATIRVGENEAPVEIEDEFFLLSRLHSQRIWDYQKTASDAGVGRSLRPPSSAVSPWTIFFAEFNAHGQVLIPEFRLLLPGAFRGDVPPYLNVRGHLEALHSALRIYDSVLLETHGFSADDFAAFLVSASRVWADAVIETPRRLMTFFVTGTVLAAQADFTRGLVRAAESVSADLSLELSSSPTDVMNRLMSWATWDVERLRLINIHSRTGHRLILPVGGHAVLDLSFVHEVIHDLFLELSSLAGASGNLRGDWFEEETRTMLSSAGVEVVELPRRLKASTGETRNIDVCVRSGDMFWAIECKAYAFTAEQQRLVDGELRRWRQLQRYLEQARTAALFLERHPTGLNYSVSDSPIKVEAVVCTPQPEFIPDLDSKYWLSAGVPRILTPAELVAYVTGGAKSDAA